MVSNKELANIIFPDIKDTIEDLEKRYPARKLPEGAEVTRFAPSPTGFLHTGSLFTSLICRKVATQSGGIFYVRLEDTDTKREIQGSGEQLLSQLKVFNIVPDEGYLGDHDEGKYGPYVQSKRADIYKAAIKYLIEKGRAYPCFCSPEELEEIRKEQEAHKLNPGYYGEFARCRNISNDRAKERILNGDPFVIRFRSNGNHLNKIIVRDLVRGEFEIAQNDLDIVIYKGDGLPTYHFAHCVDDHFMRTTTVIRGEEWISSLPIHVELFEAMGWKAPKYAHLPVIMKIDAETGAKRKLSKRKDNEAAVSYFLEDGFPPEALIMYLMTIANSNFEEWIFNQKFDNMQDFKFSFEKMSLDGALFDMGKFSFFAREILGKMNEQEITERALDYAKIYNLKLYKLICDLGARTFGEILNIEKDKENPRKDYEKFGDLTSKISFFEKNRYNLLLHKKLPFNNKYNPSLIKELLIYIKDNLKFGQTEQDWFANLKDIACHFDFAPNRQEYKADPLRYRGLVGDVAEILRIALSTKKNTPNLYYVMKILDKDECLRRINIVSNKIDKLYIYN